MDDYQYSPHVTTVVVAGTDVGEASGLLVRRVLVIGGRASSPGRVQPGICWIALMGTGVRIHGSLWMASADCHGANALQTRIHDSGCIQMALNDLHYSKAAPGVLDEQL